MGIATTGIKKAPTGHDTCAVLIFTQE